MNSEPHSLRTQLLARLALPMALFVVIDAAVSYFVALHFANLAYDRWLLDSARSLAQEVKAQKGKVTFELPPTALEVFQWDDLDKTFFKIESTHLGFMAGDATLPAPPHPMTEEDTQPIYFDSLMRGQRVRVVSMVIEPKGSPEQVVVQVAETLNKRRGMMTEILLAVVAPQILLLLLGGVHVWIGINRGLDPLRALTREIAQRSPRDLAPIPDQHVPTEVRTLTHTINELLGRLAAAIATQHRFIANAAHQFRTPLAGLKVQVERVLREPHSGSLDPALLQIQHCTDRISRLTTQLLALARSENGPDDQHFRLVDLVPLSREACMEWADKALQRQIDLAFEPPGTPVTAMGDARLLHELLVNLLDNAVRYGRPSGHIIVSLSAMPVPTLSVEDDGPGIPPEEEERIFERFYRIPGSSGEGCGLGLAIVKEIVDLHGARIRVAQASEIGGTRLTIRFPVFRPNTAA